MASTWSHSLVSTVALVVVVAATTRASNSAARREQGVFITVTVEAKQVVLRVEGGLALWLSD
jgi:hypothetical protein